MVEIGFLTESDRAAWEALARDMDAYFETVRSDTDYERAWRGLIDGEQRGIAARLDGRMVGIAHYLFHVAIWEPGRNYLGDLFVDEAARRRGIAAEMIRWVARDGEQHGCPALYWNTMEDAPARAMYDKIARHIQGLVTYVYRRTRES